MKKILTLILISLMAFFARCIFDSADKDDNNNVGDSEMYTISGKITDFSNNGITDVVVSLSASATYTTGSTGLYIFTDISNGTYTIIPGKQGYTFDPESRQVPINGENVSGLNFSGTFIGSNGLLAETYLPFAEDVSYNYTTLTTYADGSPDEIEPYTDTITGATAYSGITYRIMESSHTKTGEVQDTQYFRIADNILWKYVWGEEIFVKSSAIISPTVILRKALLEPSEHPLFNFNMSPGESWEIYIGITKRYTGTYLGLEDVIVTAGTFRNCAKFKLVLNDIETNTGGNETYIEELYSEKTFWFAPNVGIVKRYEIKMVYGEIYATETDDLTSYTIP